MRLPHRHPAFAATFAMILLAPLVHGQSTQSGLEARLLNQHLFLREPWRDDHLKFDSAGDTPTHCSPPTGKHCSPSFTLSGVDIAAVHMQDDKLVVTGSRFWLEFVQAGPTRVPLTDSIKIEIAAAPGNDYGPALDKIFARDLPELAPSLPDLWHRFAYKVFLKQELADGPRKIPQGNHDVPSPQTTSRIHQPTVLKFVQPVYTEPARRMHYTASVRVNFVVGTDGKVYDIRVVKAAGLALDEQAADAVSKYTFKPATKDGVPVAVELDIEVTFETS